jgi:hypothetical protein
MLNLALGYVIRRVTHFKRALTSTHAFPDFEKMKVFTFASPVLEPVPAVTKILS